MSTYNRQVQFGKYIRKKMIEVNIMEDIIAHSNISLLRPSDQKKPEIKQFSVQKLTPVLTDSIFLVLALFQEFKPSYDCVSY
jgi:hypothetical protein